MKCVVIEKPGILKVTEKSLKPIEKGFARVKVKACAICATDLEILDGNIPVNYPIIPGHEWSGVVEEVFDVNDKNWIGKRVTGCNDVVCGKCDACRSGEWRYCKDFEEIGFKRDGGYAEYIDVPVSGLVELPENVSFEQGALAEPMGVALGIWDKIKPEFGKNCMIYGAGSIGLFCLAVAKAMGMRKIVVVASSNKRLKIAKELGAYATISTKEENLFKMMNKYHPEGTDYIIEATGIEECISNSFKLCKRGGYVALGGYGRGKIMNIRIDDIHIKNLHVIGAGNNWNQYNKAIAMMADKSVDLNKFITKIISLDEIEEGMRFVRNRPEGFVKAVIKF